MVVVDPAEPFRVVAVGLVVPVEGEVVPVAEELCPIELTPIGRASFPGSIARRTMPVTTIAAITSAPRQFVLSWFTRLQPRDDSPGLSPHPDRGQARDAAGGLAVGGGVGDHGIVKGDRVEVVVDVGDGATRTYEILASRAGRRVETTTGRGIVEVAEVTRTGQVVRTARFMQTRVIAVVEHPVDDGIADGDTSPRARPPDPGLPLDLDAG